MNDQSVFRIKLLTFKKLALSYRHTRLLYGNGAVKSVLVIMEVPKWSLISGGVSCIPESHTVISFVVAIGSRRVRVLSVKTVILVG